MIDNRAIWKRPWAMTLMVLIASGIGAWLALDRPLPESWMDNTSRPQLEIPKIFQQAEPNRIFCAESVDTGECSCISSGGERPEVSLQECQRRARASDTRSEDPD